MPPRQKMINLLYVILIAMLAINISTDVLEGYKLMNEDFEARISGLEVYNDSLLAKITREGSEEEQQVSAEMSGRMHELRSTLHELREEIARLADHDDYKPGMIKAHDDLIAVPTLFLSATTGRGKELRRSVDSLKTFALSHVINDSRYEYVNSYLTLKSNTRGISWEKETFSYLPAIGGVAFLNKLEEEVLLVTNEVYRSMLYDDRTETSRNRHYILINEEQHAVNEDGTVDAPVVLLSSSEDVLYRQYENPLNLFSIGIPADQLTFGMTNGKIYSTGDACIAVPNAGAKDATVYVDGMKDGAKARLFECRYHVKSLPDPFAYLVYKNNQGKSVEYRGNVPISKESLLNMIQLGARADEGPDVSYTVQSFETVLIKAATNKVTTLRSAGNALSGEQRRQIENLGHDDKFYITSILVSGTGGVKKQIAPINVIIM